jgi:hypothetical protein
VISIADFRATVTAGVMERPNFAVFAAYHCNGIVTDLQSEILPRFGDLEGVAGENPVLVPDLLKILALNAFIAVESARQRVPGFTLCNQVKNAFFIVHCYPPIGDMVLSLYVPGQTSQTTFAVGNSCVGVIDEHVARVPKPGEKSVPGR